MGDFDWDDSNRDHIARHGVTPDEAEQAYLLDPLDLDSYEENDETRYDTLGETKRGRILQIVTTIRKEKIRVVTCFEPIATLRKRYLEYKKTSNE